MNPKNISEEYFLLLILSTLGACVLAYAAHLASLLLGLELMSIALYALIAYPDKTKLPLEAAIKYLVLSGAASATMLFGFALLYGITGTLQFASMGDQLLMQTNIKRMLAYSSIAHMGYLVIILVVGSNMDQRPLAIEAGMYYLIAYTVTTVAAFGMLTLLSTEGHHRENVQLHDVSGLFWHQPLYAGLMMVALLSLAGIPLTAGFIAKFYLISAAVSDLRWILLASLVVGSGIGIYYYLRVIFYMTRRVEEHNNNPVAPTGLLVKATSCALIAGILLLGTLPQPLMEYLRSILQGIN